MGATVDELRQLSLLLDSALELDRAGRETWLRSLSGDAERLRPTLCALLAEDERSDAAQRLDRGVAFDPPASHADDHAAGQHVGPYRLLRPIGRGGMGEVWLAEPVDGQIKRQVALKLPTLGLQRRTLVQRFARERDVLASLTHAHIARLYDAGVGDEGQPYLALEFVEGQPITTYCETQRLGLLQRVQLLLQVMDAVQHAHANLVIHRDLKPGNVLVGADGQAMLLDFGIAKLLQADETQAPETELTRAGGRALTLAYAAPEQIGGTPVSIATDVWALGVLLYELLTGGRPFQGSRSEIEQAILSQEPVPPRQLPPGLATIVLKALKKTTAERYATVAAFADDLGRWQRGEPVLAQPDSRGYRLRRFAARHRAALLIAATVSALLISAAAVSIRQAQLARQQTQLAQVEARTAQAVQDFLEGIFKANSGDQVDPIAARQRTARQLLDEGAARVDLALRDVPMARLRVLGTLADVYRQMGLLDAAAKLLEARSEGFAALGERQAAAQVIALSQWAEILVQAGSRAKAREVLKRAEWVSRTLPDSAEASKASYQVALAALHADAGDAQGLPAAEAQLAALRLQPPTVDRLRLLVMIAAMHSGQGRFDRARERLLEAISLAPQLPGGAASELSAVYAGLADAEAWAGKIEAAEAAQRKAVQVSEGNAGPGSLQAVNALVGLAAHFNSAGRLREGIETLRDARTRASAWLPSEIRTDRLRSIMVTEARALRAFGQVENSLALLDQARSMMVDEKSNPPQWVWWQVVRSAALVDLGRYDEARSGLEAASGLIATDRLATSNLRHAVLMRQLALELATGDAAAAHAKWRQLSGTGLRGDPDRKCDPVGLLLEAHIELLRSRPTAAVSAANQARAGLRVSDAALYRESADIEALLVLSKAQRSLGQRDPALTHARRALAQAERLYDPEFSTTLASAQVAVGEALLLSNDRVAAQQMLNRARAIHARHPRLGQHLTRPLQQLSAALADR